jgi:predicted peptidase
VAPVGLRSSALGQTERRATAITQVFGDGQKLTAWPWNTTSPSTARA